MGFSTQQGRRGLGAHALSPRHICQSGRGEGKGRGREILNVIRSADMVLYIVDPFQDAHFNVLHRELHNAGLRLNETKPPVFIKRTERGGIDVRSTVEQTHLTSEEMGEIIRSFGYTSAIVTLRNDTTAEQIVDCLAENRIYEKAVVAINKIDIATEDDLVRATKALPQDWPITVSYTHLTLPTIYSV